MQDTAHNIILKVVEPIEQILTIRLAYLDVCICKREIHHDACFFDRVNEIKVDYIHLMYLNEIRTLRQYYLRRRRTAKGH